jgi:hypothetical protein
VGLRSSGRAAAGAFVDRSAYFYFFAPPTYRTTAEDPACVLIHLPVNCYRDHLTSVGLVGVSVLVLDVPCKVADGVPSHRGSSLLK